MAEISIDDESVTVLLSTGEEVEALHGDVTVPRSSIVEARAVPDGMAEIKGIRAPGTGFPGVIAVGTWRGAGRTTFAVCHGPKPAVVFELKGERFDRIVVTLDDPDAVLRSLA